MESPVVTSAEMRAAEEAAFASGHTAEALMDVAAAGIVHTISSFFPLPGRCVVFAGKGHNAGDALTAAHLLQRSGWAIEIHLAFPATKCSKLTQKKLRALRDESGKSPGPATRARPIVLDGLLGLGAEPPLRKPIIAACREINRLRREENAFIIALDLPTGLNADTGEPDADCVVADLTITLGFAKRGLIADRALDHTGRLERVPLPGLTPPPTADAILADTAALRALRPRRPFSTYKNECGRIGVIGGSTGLTGAAILCASGALRGGAGLVELFVPKGIYEIIAGSAPAEVMVKPIHSYASLLDANIDVWAIGPGLGPGHAVDLQHVLERAPQPMVIDAGALDLLAAHPALLNRSAGPRLLTPHPGEMMRLFPVAADTRAERARLFCAKHPVTLLFKGSRTIVAEHGQPLSYNTTGHPGMATGGMGDVLTGVCAALLGQKLTPFHAARLAAWLCGRAAELAIFNGNASEESLLPSDVLENLGRAFTALS